MTDKDKLPPALLSLSLVLLTVLLRLGAGQWNLWYWDEGYMAELSLDLSRFDRPHGGALWWDGLFPLTSNWLPPVTAAPFHWIPGLDPLQAVRLWAALLGGLCSYLLLRIGTRQSGLFVGVLAAFAYATLPLCLRLGAMGLYHALASVFALAAVEQTLVEEGRHERRGLYLAGLSLASCLWLWPLPLALLGRRWLQGKRPGLVELCLSFGPLALLLGGQALVGGEQARQSLMTLFGGSSNLILSVMAADLSAFPLLPLGVLGLCLNPAFRSWLAPAAALFILEIFRQRIRLHGSAYALLPVLPWLCLGLAGLAGLAWKRRRWAGVALTAALFWPAWRCDLSALADFSVQPKGGRAAAAYLATVCKPGDLVVSQPPLNWLLRGVCDAVEPSHFSAYQGWPGLLLSQDLPASAFTRPLEVEKIRYYVSRPGEFRPHALMLSNALLPLRMEKEGWPKVWEGEGFRIWANPRWKGVKPQKDPVLGHPRHYQTAAVHARRMGMDSLADLAEARAKATASPSGGTKPLPGPAPR